MKYGLSVTTAPTADPVSLDEAKDQCGISRDVGYWDFKLRTLIKAARRKVEDDTSRALCTQTIDFGLDGWPCGLEPIYLPRNPVSSVSYIKYYDTSNAQQTLSTNVYKTVLDREPAEIWLKNAQSWPSLYGEVNVISIRFVAGYSADYQSVPEGLRAACLLLIGAWFANEEPPDVAYNALINQHRVGDDCHAYA